MAKKNKSPRLSGAPTGLASLSAIDGMLADALLALQSVERLVLVVVNGRIVKV